MPLGQRQEVSLVGDLLAQQGPHIEDERFVAVGQNLDQMWAFLQTKALERAVEIVDLAGKIAVDEHLGVAGPDFQPQRAGRSIDGIVVVPVARVAVAPVPVGIGVRVVGRVVVGTVTEAETYTERVGSPRNRTRCRKSPARSIPAGGCGHPAAVSRIPSG